MRTWFAGRKTCVPFLRDYLLRSPGDWLERTTNLVRLTEPPRCGHFAPFEEPELCARELRAFFRPYRTAANG